MIQYIVYRGEYPFNEVLGTVEAPADRPDIALQQAIKGFKTVDHHPVVEPASRGLYH
jgi:hypothetical protein